MPSLTLYVDTTARTLVQGYTNTLPATLPAVNISDSINLTIIFLAQTGIPSAPYSYVNLSASTVKAILGIVAGIPNYGTFCLFDGTNTSNPINYNDIPMTVQGDLINLTSLTSPTVTGGVGGPWTITNGVNGVGPTLTPALNQLSPSTTPIITLQAPGSSTTSAVYLVRLALNPIAEQTTWTVGGSPSYGFTGSLTPNPVALQRLMGAFLSMNFSLMIQVTTGGDIETYINATLAIQNTLLPTGASYTSPTTGAGYTPAFTSIATLQALSTANVLAVGFVAVGLIGGVPAQFRLQTGNTGILPNDYNASTNNVSWYQIQ